MWGNIGVLGGFALAGIFVALNKRSDTTISHILYWIWFVLVLVLVVILQLNNDKY